ncbi:hypothetical protein CRENBAI_015225 [Crenichthys baileyi]|uniref:Uncharacterized protein n=1 Tax=Crenichthys baileyi TaxID=28760 RepID=A0AAV9RJJ5_9TELE
MRNITRSHHVKLTTFAQEQPQDIGETTYIPVRSFFVWRLPRNAPHCSVVFPWKGLPSDREICKALGAQYRSTYTCDFQVSSQGHDDNNKRDEKLALLRNGLQK